MKTVGTTLTKKVRISNMAEFYGTLQGARGEATRLGHKSSGITTTAASWKGAIRTRLYDVEGVTNAVIELTPWHGTGEYRELYRGPLAELAKKGIAT